MVYTIFLIRYMFLSLNFKIWLEVSKICSCIGAYLWISIVVAISKLPTFYGFHFSSLYKLFVWFYFLKLMTLIQWWQKYIKQCTLRERKYYCSCWSYKGVACPPYIVHLDLVGLWFVLLWPPWLTHDPLSYLVLALLFCEYLYHDESDLWTIYFMVGPFVVYGSHCIFGPLYFRVLLYDTLRNFGPLVHYPKSFLFYDFTL